MKWMTTCKETTALASRALDGRLPLGERIALRVHLAICANCARFTRQVAVMRKVLQTAPTEGSGPGLPEDARRRIETKLRNTLGR